MFIWRYLGWLEGYGIENCIIRKVLVVYFFEGIFFKFIIRIQLDIIDIQQSKIMILNEGIIVVKEY